MRSANLLLDLLPRQGFVKIDGQYEKSGRAAGRVHPIGHAPLRLCTTSELALLAAATESYNAGMEFSTYGVRSQIDVVSAQRQLSLRSQSGLCSSVDQEKRPMTDIDNAPQRKYLGKIVSIGIIAAAVMSGLHVADETTRSPRTDDAEVFANFIGIALQVNGPITRLEVADNAFIKQGEMLFQIDSRRYEYALEKAPIS